MASFRPPKRAPGGDDDDARKRARAMACVATRDAIRGTRARAVD